MASRRVHGQVLFYHELRRDHARLGHLAHRRCWRIYSTAEGDTEWAQGVTLALTVVLHEREHIIPKLDPVGDEPIASSADRLGNIIDASHMERPAHGR